ncbi:AAA family ATPase [Phyllobacterium myrsinacearum]|uniref:DNA repair exonuclease SbcCD ATPase subunit n=1 Tax=Phyllobacterium myrsinacearum TaxID=28101 RepID=A0A839EZI6_9HYPH|nr:AAA family ATPase [Phyllobacterium myrsinacearum]MBA8881787.1 DNA repair exonuclease SbcCD ATPase subunit [Phyllobacterium myrsinacearum]
MKFTLLKIENFLAITEAEFRLHDRGLVLIQGVNKADTSADSNGAGKSSLPDALCWVLYGITARDASGDEVINDRAGKGTKVSVDVEDDEDIYRVIRHRKHPKGKNALHLLHLQKDGTINDLTQGTDKLTQAKVNTIIGASHDVFKSSIYAAQEQMPDLPKMTDKMLKMLIEEASGVTVLEESYKLARDKLTTERGTRDAIAQQIEKLTEKKDWHERNKTSLQDQIDGWEENRSESVTSGTAELKQHVEDVKALDEEIAAAGHAVLAAAVKECDDKILAVSEEQKQLMQLNQKVAQATSTVNLTRMEAKQTQDAHARQKGKIAAIDHRVGCPCDECGREITEAEIEASRVSAMGVLKTLVDNFTTQKNALEDARKALTLITDKRDAFEATMTDISAVSALRAAKQRELDAVNEVIVKRRNLAQKAKDLAEAIKTLKAQENPHRLGITKIDRELLTISAEICKASEQLRLAEGTVDIAETVVKVFSPSGVRAHILDEVTPYLNQQTAKYLSIMSDSNIEATWTTLVKNAKGELRENFAIEVANEKGGKSFRLLSGGEKRKVRISAALALQDLVATRARKPIELFIGDEIDDALDAAGLERLTQILEEKATERGSVFIISHNSLRDWVSQIITIQKEVGGETTLIEETV